MQLKKITAKFIYLSIRHKLDKMEVMDRMLFAMKEYTKHGAKITLNSPTNGKMKVIVNGKSAILDYSSDKTSLSLTYGRMSHITNPDIRSAIDDAGGIMELADILAVDCSTIRRWDRQGLSQLARMALKQVSSEIEGENDG